MKSGVYLEYAKQLIEKKEKHIIVSVQRKD